MAKWTIDLVADRFEAAAETAERLPPLRSQGYFNTWPDIIRQQWEGYAIEPDDRREPPTYAAVERMMETMTWVNWLEIEQRHLVWMRARRYGWREIATRLACNRVTAWRRWQRALQAVAEQLNRR